MYHLKTMKLLRPQESLTVLKNKDSFTVQWFVDYFLKYDDDSDCKYIFDNLSENTKIEIKARVGEIVKSLQEQRMDMEKQRMDMEKQRMDMEKQIEAVQEQRRECRERTKVWQELNYQVLKQLEIVRENRRQLGF